MEYRRFAASLFLSFLLVVFWIACISTPLLAQQTPPVDFLDLVKTGSVQQVQEAIDRGVVLNTRDKNGFTALMIAAWYNQSSEVITILLKAGSDLNARGKYGLTPLMIAAAFSKNLAVMATLLNAGADLNARDEYGGTTLSNAARYNANPEVVTILLRAGADISARDNDGRTPLIAAARLNQNPEVISTLLKAGADLNEQDKSGWATLMNAAALNKNPDVITTLLKAGADLNARDKNGWTTLMAAARYNQNSNVITTVLKAGADLNAQNKDGLTALMLAARYNQNPEVVSGLLEAGADANAESQDGMTAFVYAQFNDKLKGRVAYQKLNEARSIGEAPVGLQYGNNKVLIHVYSGAVFELAYGDFFRVGAQNVDEVGKDVTVAYAYFGESYHITVTIYVYPTNAGAATVDRLRSHYQQVRNDIFTVQKNVQQVLEQENIYDFASGDRFGILAGFNLEMNNDRMMSFLFLFGEKEWFIKWRVSYPGIVHGREGLANKIANLVSSFNYSTIK